MAIAVRRAEKEDATRIAEFALQLIDQHVDYDPVRFSRIGDVSGMANYFTGRMAAANAAVFIAETDGSAVGFAYMEFEPILYADLAVKVAWLHDIFVEPNARSSGAGKLLLEAVAEEAQRLGANKVLLSVAAANASAQKFFGRMGFRRTMNEMMLVIGN